MNAADALRESLKAAINRSFDAARPLGKPEAIAKVLRKFERELGGVSAGRPQRDRVLEAIRQYLRSGLRGLDGARVRHLCWGLAEPYRAGEKPLLEQTERFAELARGLESMAREGRLSFPAWRGLVICYFSLQGPRARGEAKASWERLRALLSSTVQSVYEARRGRREPPRWLSTLHENQELLTENPCASYAEDHLRGETARIERLKADLEIPDHSWFWDALVMSTVYKSTTRSDAQFKALIPQLISLISPRAAFIRDRGLATILERFGACSERSIHRPLLDYAIAKEVWGSPRVLNSPRWGLVKEDVRKMVAGWMHERNLVDFFDLLSRDPHTDRDRLEFWLRYIDEIDDSYIALGSEARSTTKAAYRDLLHRHRDTLCYLTDGQAGNNAFIMRLGNHVVVEFGMVGNACYVYRVDHLPFELGERKGYRVNLDLKDRSKEGVYRQPHMSGWQGDLERALKRRGIHPGPDSATRARLSAQMQARASAQAGAPDIDLSTAIGYLPEEKFWAFVNARNLRHRVEDNREKNGWLWVRHARQDDDIGRQLAYWGFNYKGTEKGWGR